MKLATALIAFAVAGMLLAGCSSDSDETPMYVPETPTAAPQPTKTGSIPTPKTDPSKPAPEPDTNPSARESPGDQKAKDAYRLFQEGKDYAATLAEAGDSAWAPVVRDLIDAGKEESKLSPATASAADAWKTKIDPLYVEALAEAFAVGLDAVHLVKRVAAKSARDYGTEDRAKEWEAMPEPG
jgi:hypothetical protein